MPVTGAPVTGMTVVTPVTTGTPSTGAHVPCVHDGGGEKTIELLHRQIVPLSHGLNWQIRPRIVLQVHGLQLTVIIMRQPQVVLAKYFLPTCMPLEASRYLPCFVG